jgi:hypothetical protein
MKEQLLQLYKEKQESFRNVLSSFPSDDLAGPFLMSPSPFYKEQKSPLLIVGQETNGWTYFVDEIERQMYTYEQYNVGSNLDHLPFWNIIRKVEKALGNDPHSCAWTNLSRFDLYGGKSYGKYQKVIKGLDRIIVDEIKICTPEICIFFTGPDFDARLRRIFKDMDFVAIPGWNMKQLSMLRHPLLPYLTFRSYHPKSLRLKNLENNFIEFISDLSARKHKLTQRYSLLEDA